MEKSHVLTIAIRYPPTPVSDIRAPAAVENIDVLSMLLTASQATQGSLDPSCF